MPKVRPTVRVYVKTLNKDGDVWTSEGDLILCHVCESKFDYNKSRCGFLVEQHVKSVKHRNHLELKTKKQSLLSESLENVAGNS